MFVDQFQSFERRHEYTQPWASCCLGNLIGTSFEESTNVIPYYKRLNTCTKKSSSYVYQGTSVLPNVNKAIQLNLIAFQVLTLIVLVRLFLGCWVQFCSVSCPSLQRMTRRLLRSFKTSFTIKSF